MEIFFEGGKNFGQGGGEELDRVGKWRGGYRLDRFPYCGSRPVPNNCQRQGYKLRGSSVNRACDLLIGSLYALETRLEENDTYARAYHGEITHARSLRINPRFYLSCRVANRNLFALGESPATWNRSNSDFDARE